MECCQGGDQSVKGVRDCICICPCPRRRKERRVLRDAICSHFNVSLMLSGWLVTNTKTVWSLSRSHCRCNPAIYRAQATSKTQQKHATQANPQREQPHVFATYRSPGVPQTFPPYWILPVLQEALSTFELPGSQISSRAGKSVVIHA